MTPRRRRDCDLKHRVALGVGMRTMNADILPLSSATTAAAPVPLIDLVEQFESISDEVRSVVDRVLATQKFILGEDVTAFEQQVASYCDARHGIGCASGTDALLLALMALQI